MCPIHLCISKDAGGLGAPRRACSAIALRNFSEGALASAFVISDQSGTSNFGREAINGISHAMTNVHVSISQHWAVLNIQP